MLHLFFATVLLGTALAPGRDERLEVRIENVERREGQVSFRVVMRNPGPTPLLLEETTKGTREPYAVNIERATGFSRLGVRRSASGCPASGCFCLVCPGVR